MGGGIHDGTEYWMFNAYDNYVRRQTEVATMSERLTPERLAELRLIAEAAKYGDHGDNARHIAAFDPPTVLALLDEIERLQHEVMHLRDFLAESEGLASHLRQQYEALRAAVEGVAERIGEAAATAYQRYEWKADPHDQGCAHGLEHAERMVRRILSDACPYCSAPMEDDPGRYPSGDVDMAWTCGTWRMIDGVTFRSDGCGAREVADDV